MMAQGREGAAEPVDPSLPIGPQIHQWLRLAVITGHLAPGARVSEADLALAHGVSRQPVREAFIKLAEEGLVEVRPQRGTFVSRISLRAVEDARFMREAIEADLARALAQAVYPAMVVELRRQLARQTALSGSDPHAFTALDDLFHRTIAVAAGREGAWRVLEGLKAQMDRVRYITARRFPLDELMAQHAAIVEAIAARDPDAAEESVRRHLRRILQHLPIIRSDAPDLFRE